MPFSKMIRNLKINGFNSLSKGHKLRLKVVMHPLTSAVRSPRHVDHCVLSNMVYTARYRRAKIMSLSTNKQTNKQRPHRLSGWISNHNLFCWLQEIYPTIKYQHRKWICITILISNQNESQAHRPFYAS